MGVILCLSESRLTLLQRRRPTRACLAQLFELAAAAATTHKASQQEGIPQGEEARGYRDAAHGGRDTAPASEEEKEVVPYVQDSVVVASTFAAPLTCFSSTLVTSARYCFLDLFPYLRSLPSTSSAPFAHPHLRATRMSHALPCCLLSAACIIL